MERVLDKDAGNWPARMADTLQTLESEADATGLEALDVSVLNYMVCGASIARNLLAVEQGSQTGLALLGAQPFSAREDASIVHACAVEAIEQTSQVLQHVRGWLTQPDLARVCSADGIRHLFHGLSNQLVSINCYAELLVLELPDDSIAFAPFKALSAASTQASRVAHDRSVLQRLLNEREELAGTERVAKEREILTVLITMLCATATSFPRGGWQAHRDVLERAAERLPELESRVLREAVRRYEALAA